MQKFLKKILFAGALILLCNSSFADGPGFPEDPDYDPDTEVPLDGGVGVLLLAGAVYGIKKIRGNRKD